MVITRGLVPCELQLRKASLKSVNLLNRLPFHQLIVPPVPNTVRVSSRPTMLDQNQGYSLRKCGVVGLDVDIGDQPSDNPGVPRDEGQIRDRHLVSDQILLLRKYRVEYPEDPLDLVVVPLDRARDLLRVEMLEPRRLTKVWTGWLSQRRAMGVHEAGTHP